MPSTSLMMHPQGCRSRCFSRKNITRGLYAACDFPFPPAQLRRTHSQDEKPYAPPIPAAVHSLLEEKPPPTSHTHLWWTKQRPPELRLPGATKEPDVGKPRFRPTAPARSCRARRRTGERTRTALARSLPSQAGVWANGQRSDGVHACL